MAAVTIDSPRWLEGWGDSGPGSATDPAASPPAPVLRLAGAGTRRPDPGLAARRRLAVQVVLALLLAAALAVASIAVTRPATAGSAPVGRRTHVVQAGETYWSIAAGLSDGRDLRIAVDALVDANGGRALFPGDRIEIP